MASKSHAWTFPRDEFARRPGDETHPLARNHGPDWRRKLEIRDYPYAETDEGGFYDFFGALPFDAAPDLTAIGESAAYARVTAGMGGAL